MKLQPYIDKLERAPEYKNFQKKYKDAFMVAGFFVLDFESGQHLNQLDFYVPSEKKIAAFTLDRRVVMQLLDTINSKVPEKLKSSTKIDLDELHGILEDEMKNRNISEEIKKMIAILQNLDGKNIWNVNCVLSGMSILNAHVEDDTKTILRMEKKSILDYIKRMPNLSMQPNENMQGGEIQPENPEDKLKKLQQLEAEIAKEKEELVKNMENQGNVNKKQSPKQEKPKKVSKIKDISG